MTFQCPCCENVVYILKDLIIHASEYSSENDSSDVLSEPDPQTVVLKTSMDSETQEDIPFQHNTKRVRTCIHPTSKNSVQH